MNINSEFAEKQVLGAILQDPEFAQTATEQLTTEHFTDEKRRKVLEAIQNTEGDINIVSVSETMRLQGTLDSVGGMDYLADLSYDAVITATADSYLDIVIKNRLARLNYKLVYEAGQSLKNGNLKKAETLISNLDFGEDKGADKSISEISEEFKEFLDSNEEEYIDTGYEDLDGLLKGLHGGDLVIVAARPAMGKSAFAVNVMENVVLEDIKSVLLFSFEMSTSQIFARMVSIYSKVRMESILGKSLSLAESKIVKRASDELGHEGFYLYDRADLATVGGISRIAEEEKKKHDIKLIIIDYLQLMSVPGMNGDNRNGEISKITRGLKLLAKKLDIPIILLSQLSRATEKRGTKMPMLSDLRDSGAIEQDADIVMFLHRPGYYGDKENDGVCLVNVAKHRQGPTGTIDLAWIDRYTAFGDLERSQWMSDES